MVTKAGTGQDARSGTAPVNSSSSRQIVNALEGDERSIKLTMVCVLQSDKSRFDRI